MSTVFTPLIGRLGNQLFQYVHARAFAEQNGHTLVTPWWSGEEIFDLNDKHGVGGDITLDGYRQDQASLIYTRSQVKEWLRFREPILYTTEVLAHRRVGDYPASGYVLVSEQSYLKAAEKFGHDKPKLVTEEGGKSFAEDFRRMVGCAVLFRGNSTFSWWAATLSTAKVYAPLITGLAGGKEHDCEFVCGNWPRFSDLAFTTDLHLPE